MQDAAFVTMQVAAATAPVDYFEKYSEIPKAAKFCRQFGIEIM